MLSHPERGLSFTTSRPFVLGIEFDRRKSVLTYFCGIVLKLLYSTFMTYYYTMIDKL